MTICRSDVFSNAWSALSVQDFCFDSIYKILTSCMFTLAPIDCTHSTILGISSAPQLVHLIRTRKSPHLHQKRQTQRTGNTKPHHRPPGPNNLLIGELAPCIPHQMPDPVHGVEGKGERKERFQPHLRHGGHARDCCSDARGLQVPAQ